MLLNCVSSEKDIGSFIANFPDGAGSIELIVAGTVDCIKLLHLTQDGGGTVLSIEFDTTTPLDLSVAASL